MTRPSFADGVRASVAGGVDRFVARYLFTRTPVSSDAGANARKAAKRLELLARIEERYALPAWVESADAFFPRVAATDLRIGRIGDYRSGGEVSELRWTTALAPMVDEPEVHQALGLRAERNHRAIARGFFHRGAPRPAIVLVHGYRGGEFAVEERFFPLRWLFERGLDVVLAVLPHHGQRGDRRQRPLLPSSDPRLTIESFRHAIVDLRTLVAVLRDRGAPDVGVMGMSLGGYSTALLATVEPLAFAFPMIPLGSMADIARDERRLVGTPEQQLALYEAIDRVHRVVSPTARPALVPRERMLVIGGASDRITPIAHAEKLAAHFDVPLHVFPGGHILQLGRDVALQKVDRVLRDAGLIRTS